MSSRTAIIIGAGVIGLSAAYHLARKKFGRVVLLDKGPVGDGSSSRAAGIITGLLWTEAGVLARKKSLQLFRELSLELDGYEFQDVGCLNLFDAQSWPRQQELLPLYQRLGAPFDILTPAEMLCRWPALHPNEELMGIFDPLGGYSEPEEYLPALTKRIKELGVEIRERQAVMDFLTRNARINGVRTQQGDIEGDAVVCTVYAWTLRLIERIGLRLPVKAFVHQRYVTRPLASPVKIPAVNVAPLKGYIRPSSGSRLLVGIETSEREEYRVPSTTFHMSELSAPSELKERIMKDFVHLAPDLGKTSFESEKVGLLTFSMDNEPILGPVASRPGLYVAVAFHSGGFAYNPVAGLLLAEYVAEGRTSIDVSTFSPDRFASQEVNAYLASGLQQKDVLPRRH